MEEYQTVDLVIQMMERFDSGMQWWASVTVGVIAVAHFASDKLNRFFVIMLAVLYTSFTLSVAGMLFTFSQAFSGYWIDLRALQQSEGVSQGTADLLQASSNPLMTTLTMPVFLMAFFGTIGFLIYSYLRTRATQDH